MKTKIFIPFRTFIIFLLLQCLIYIGISANEGSVTEDKVIQTIYMKGVPHTDRNGKYLSRYDPEHSFFPIGIWGAPKPGEIQGQNYDWNDLVKAGFNTIWPWPMGEENALEQAQKSGLQVVLMTKRGENLFSKIKNHPNLLAVVWQDEPLLQGKSLEEELTKFLAFKGMMEKTAPDLPVFINNCSWITHSDWIKWNRSGHIACHDNYPIWPVTKSIAFGSFGKAPNGIPQSVSLSAKINKEQKPVWLIVQAFEADEPPDVDFPFRYPTPTQLRAMVYAGIIHGATGICYFTWDSYVSRDGKIFGISPNPAADPRNDHKTPATSIRLVSAKALWETAALINREINVLTPAILSNTIGEQCKFKVEKKGESITAIPIRCLLKPHPKQGFILFSVNLDNAVIKATYRFEKALKDVKILFENRPRIEIAGESKEFTVDFEPFDTHIFHIFLNRQ